MVSEVIAIGSVCLSCLDTRFDVLKYGTSATQRPNFVLIYVDFGFISFFHFVNVPFPFNCSILPLSLRLIMCTYSVDVVVSFVLWFVTCVFYILSLGLECVRILFLHVFVIYFALVS